VQVQEENYLQLEAANKALDDHDRTIARFIAQQWREQQIKAAGGSEEVARQRARDSGGSFDDQVHDHYNLALVELYLTKKIMARIQVSVSDLRRYYDQHKEDEFTQHAQARFRVIKVSIADSGTSAEAATRAEQALQRLKDGADFADEAAKTNDDPYLKNARGDVGWVQQGNFVDRKVEEAVWKLQPGQYTDHPIASADGRFLYIAELTERKPGKVRSFDSDEVQGQIERTLRGQQIDAMRLHLIEELRRDAVILPERNGMEIAVAMAMQRYAGWAGAGR